MNTETTEEQEIEETFGVPATFGISDDRSAEWLLRKLNECDGAAERAQKWAQEIAEDCAKEKKRLLERFGVELERYTLEQLEGKKSKSFKLPSGTVGFRSQAEKLVVTNEIEYSKWAKENLPSAIETQLSLIVEDLSDAAKTALRDFAAHHELPNAEFKQTVKKSVINEFFKHNGVLPDGCEYVPPTEKFFVK